MNNLAKIAGVIGLLAAGSAGAATVTIDFTSNGRIAKGSRQALVDLGVDISGSYYRFRDGSLRLGADTNVGADRHGLNSNNCGPKDCGRAQTAIDSIGRDELVSFSFGQDVRIVGVEFGKFRGYGFDLFQGSDLAGSFRKGAAFVPTGWDDSFSFGARSVKAGGNKKQSRFKIASITIAVPAVPIPASGLLLAGAVGGVAALRRRRAR